MSRFLLANNWTTKIVIMFHLKQPKIEALEWAFYEFYRILQMLKKYNECHTLYIYCDINKLYVNY